MIHLLKKNKSGSCLGKLVPNPESKYPEVDKWQLSKFVTRKLVPITGHKPFPLDELLLMVSSLVYFRPSLICDWGTHIGKSARIFYETTQAFGISSSIHSFDLPNPADHAEHPGEQRGQLVKHLQKVRLHDEDGVSGALKVYQETQPNSTLFFLDGDHSYQSVLGELTELSLKVEQPVMLVHDTFFQDHLAGYNLGPHQAIQDFLKQNPNYLTVETNLGLPGMTLLYQKKL